MKPQKTKVVKKFLKSQGWGRVRGGKGSHEIWGNPETGDSLSIPSGHGEVSPGVIRQIKALLPDVPKEWK
jgi:predicted RNA binding protein YcfA (HicA-like mRNA interferase family)